MQKAKNIKETLKRRKAYFTRKQDVLQSDDNN